MKVFIVDIHAPIQNTSSGIKLVFKSNISDLKNEILDDDIVFWHYRNINSGDISSKFIDKQVGKHPFLKIERLVFFSKNNNNRNPWDEFIRNIFRDKQFQKDVDNNQLKEVVEQFRNHANYYNEYKEFLRRSIFLYIAKKFYSHMLHENELFQKKLDDLKEYKRYMPNIKDFDTVFEESKKLISNHHSDNKINYETIKSFSSYFKILIKYKKFEFLFKNSIKSLIPASIDESEYKFVSETILFKPSPKFWGKILNTKRKYIFLIAPWQTEDNFIGYNKKKHGNIYLWNPTNDGFYKINEFLKKAPDDNDFANYGFKTTVLKNALLANFYNATRRYDKKLAELENYVKGTADNKIFQGVFKNLLIQNDGNFYKTFKKGIDKNSKDQAVRSMQDLEMVNDVDDPVLFYLGLDILGQKYDQHTHDYNSKVSPFTEKFTIKSRSYNLTQLCNDIRFTIDALYFKNSIGNCQKIAIIDDNVLENNPAINGIKLSNLFNAFTGLDYSDKHFLIINPIKEIIQGINHNIKDLLFNLGGYNTLYDFYFDKRNYFKKEFEKIEAADILLVDLLYKRNIQEVANVEEGLNLISGLNRYLRDYKKETDKEIHRKKHTNSEPTIAPILAISHDDNASVIINSIKAGAKDYIVKSRIFTMPGIILKAKHTAGEKTTTYHRNFKNLYTLKNEVIGLLQKRKIPVLIEARDMKNQNYKNYEKLLKVIPKTDLHVHVGSCMTPEFIVLSSFVALINNDYETLQSLNEVITCFHSLISENKTVTFNLEILAGVEIEPESGEDWIDNLGERFKKQIKKNVGNYYTKIEENKDKESIESLSLIKSHLFEIFNIPDYLDKKKLKGKINSISNFKIAFYLLQSKKYKNSKTNKNENIKISKYDWVRIYLLVLASKYDTAEINFKIGGNDKIEDINILNYFKPNSEYSDYKDAIKELKEMFYLDNYSKNNYTVESFRKRGWFTPRNKKIDNVIKVKLKKQNVNLDFKNSPIHYILATGTRSANLIEYLKGFEYTGSEHLQHPFLIHIYARQVLAKFIKYGVSYAELRGSPNGYKNIDIGFDFTDVINCYVTAFNQSQKEVFKIFKNKNKKKRKIPNMWKFLSITKKMSLFNKIDKWKKKRMPCKVNLLIAGKRHKPINQMILDAAAAAALRKDVDNTSNNASDFIKKRLLKSEVAGFDLSGNEDGFPPELFVEEFSRLSKLHIPLTIHAGENASSKFIESAILQLGASRIGHGLSLAQDKQLIDRVIEERVCIELCPVGNHQTSHFTKKGEGGRVYPLEDYLKAGVLVSINTDNPTVSDTNIIKEYFKASETMPNQLSIWEALRIMRMGYVSAFMSLSDRKYMLELIDQYLYDLFSDKKVIDLLYDLD